MYGLGHQPQNDLHPPLISCESPRVLLSALFPSLRSSLPALSLSPFARIVRNSIKLSVVASFVQFPTKEPSEVPTLHYSHNHRSLHISQVLLRNASICCSRFSFKLLAPILFLLSVPDFVRTVVVRHERHREQRGCSRLAAVSREHN